MDSVTQKIDPNGHRYLETHGEITFVALYINHLAEDQIWQNFLSPVIYNYYARIEPTSKFLVFIETSTQKLIAIYDFQSCLNIACLHRINGATDINHIKIIDEYFLKCIRRIVDVELANLIGFKMYIYLDNFIPFGQIMPTGLTASSTLLKNRLLSDQPVYKIQYQFNADFSLKIDPPYSGEGLQNQPSIGPTPMQWSFTKSTNIGGTSMVPTNMTPTRMATNITPTSMAPWGINSCINRTTSMPQSVATSVMTFSPSTFNPAIRK